MTPPFLPADLVHRLVAALGEENVIFEAAEVELVSRNCIPYREIPAVVVYPCSVEQVQQVMQTATEFATPVWPLSTGKNWGYGARSAVYPGGITMMLSKMNRILHVDEELGYAVIEPGVSFKQLNDHLKRTGSRLWSDTAGSTPHASVLGNALDKGRGVTPYGDHWGNLCGLDVVLPDGRLLETGGGPEGHNHVRYTYKGGVGPCLDGLFAQSNLGAVVKAGVWLMPAPECFDFAVFEYGASEAQFGQFIDAFRELTFSGAMRSHPHIANDFATMCIVEQYPFHRLNGARCLSPQGVAQWAKENGVAAWTFGCGLYGSAAEVRLQKRAIKRSLGRFGVLRFIGVAVQDNWLGRLVRFAAPHVFRLMGKAPGLIDAMTPAINLFRGIPTEQFVRQAYVKALPQKPTHDIDPARDNCGVLWIGPVVPFTAQHIQRALTLCREVFARHGYELFVELMIESPRSVFVLVGVFYDRLDPAECERALNWYRDIRATMLDAGYPPYRATTISMNTAMDRNVVGKQVLEQIKSVLDPHSIVAPGRYGVRPTTPTP